MALQAEGKSLVDESSCIADLRPAAPRPMNGKAHVIYNRKAAVLARELPLYAPAPAPEPVPGVMRDAAIAVEGNDEEDEEASD